LKNAELRLSGHGVNARIGQTSGQACDESPWKSRPSEDFLAPPGRGPNAAL